MSHTNETLNYQLPQFVGSDKPAWLTDINGAFSDIDAAIYAAKSEADTNAGNITDLGTTVAGHTQTLSDQGDAITGLRTDVNGNTGSINSINSLIGSGHPTTSNQTIIGAINSTEASIAPSEDGDDLANSYSAGDQFMRGGTLYEALGALTAGTAFASLVLNTDYKVADPVVSQIGTLTNNQGDLTHLETTDKSNLVAAINEAAQSGGTLVTGVVYETYRTDITVTADGVKTIGQLLTELVNAISAYVGNLADDECFNMMSIGGNAVHRCPIVRPNILHNQSTNFYDYFSANTATATKATLTSISMQATPVFVDVEVSNAGAVTFNDRTNEVPAQDRTISIYGYKGKIYS